MAYSYLCRYCKWQNIWPSKTSPSSKLQSYKEQKKT